MGINLFHRKHKDVVALTERGKKQAEDMLKHLNIQDRILAFLEDSDTSTVYEIAEELHLPENKVREAVKILNRKNMAILRSEEE